MSSSDELFAQIADLEEETWRALTKSGSAMLEYITDDCIMQFPLGMKIGPETDPSTQDVLQSPAFVPWKSFELSKIDVTPVGKEGAIVSYLAKATRAPAQEGEGEVEFNALCCSVWRLEGEGERWALCFHQQTLAD